MTTTVPNDDDLVPILLPWQQVRDLARGFASSSGGLPAIYAASVSTVRVVAPDAVPADQLMGAPDPAVEADVRSMMRSSR